MYLMTTQWSGCSVVWPLTKPSFESASLTASGLYRSEFDSTMSSTTDALEISLLRNCSGAERFLPSCISRVPERAGGQLGVQRRRERCWCSWRCTRGRWSAQVEKVEMRKRATREEKWTRREEKGMRGGRGMGREDEHAGGETHVVAEVVVRRDEERLRACEGEVGEEKGVSRSTGRGSVRDGARAARDAAGRRERWSDAP